MIGTFTASGTARLSDVFIRCVGPVRSGAACPNMHDVTVNGAAAVLEVAGCLCFCTRRRSGESNINRRMELPLYSWLTEFCHVELTHLAFVIAAQKSE